MLKKEGKIVIGVLIIVALVVISIVNPDLTGFAVKKLDNVCKTVEVSNGEAKCGSGYTIMGGGWAGSIGSYGIPQADGFSCEDDSSSSKCYAICCDASEVDSIVVSETGRLDYGIKTYCPSGYEVVSGGFEDKIVNTDQDSLSPLNNNGWYCQDDDSSDKGSTCYAVCAKSKDTSLKLSCKTEIKKASIISGLYPQDINRVSVECSDGYFLTGGGFVDRSESNDDQDYSHPIGNSWFVQEDFSSGESVDGIGYAKCCRLEKIKEDIIEKNDIIGQEIGSIPDQEVDDIGSLTITGVTLDDTNSVPWRKPKNSDEVDLTEFHTAPDSRRISVDSKSSSLLSKKISVKKGEIYKLCVWTKSKNKKAKIKVGFTEFDGKKKLGNNWFVLNSRVVPKRWSKYCEVIRNEVATDVHVKVEAKSGKDKIWIDDATLELMPEFLPAYGCENSDTSVCLDFGGLDELQDGKIEYELKKIGPKEIGSIGEGVICISDKDGDGYDKTNDCNEDDILINPGANEICDDNIDNDCDGDIDSDDFDCIDLSSFCKIVSGSLGYGGADCGTGEGYRVTGGGWDNYIREYTYIDMGLYDCDESDPTSRCYAICCKANYIEFKEELSRGKLPEVINSYCSFGYESVSGLYELDVNKDLDTFIPLENGWSCYDDGSGYSDESSGYCGVRCAKPINPKNVLECTNIEVLNNPESGIGLAQCPTGTFLTGGGFKDAGEDDNSQITSKPVQDGWYCETGLQNQANPGSCIARCCEINHINKDNKILYDDIFVVDAGVNACVTYRKFAANLESGGGKGFNMKFNEFNLHPKKPRQINNPMILEIRYKDSFHNIHLDVDMKPRITVGYAVTGSFNFHTLHPIEGYNDGEWKIVQYILYDSDFPMLSSKGRKFSLNFQYEDTTKESVVLLDYITLREISDDKLSEFLKIQRESRGFYEIYRSKDQNIVKENFVVYSKDIMESVYPNTIPNQNEFIDEIETYSVLGEIEPMSFSVYSKNGINDLDIQISDFVHVISPNGDQGKIGTINDIEINQVTFDNKRVFRKGYGNIPDHLVDINELDIISVPELTSKRFWIKVKIPENSLSGDYVSTVTLNSDGVSKSIQLKLNVLDVKLEDSMFFNAIRGDFDIKYAVSEDILPSLMRDLGFNTIVVRAEDLPLDSSLSTAEMITQGLTKKAVIVGLKDFALDMGSLIGSGATHDISEMYEVFSSDEFKLEFGNFIQDTIDYETSQGYEVFFLISDEVGGGNVLERILYDRLAPIIQSKGGKVLATYHTSAENPINTKGEFDGVPNDIIPGVGDLVDLKIGQIYEQHQVYNKDFDNYGGFYTTQISHFRNPIYNRFLHGIFPWRLKTKVVYAFSMNHVVGDPYNDFDAAFDQEFPATEPDMLFVYPNLYGPNKLTMNAEGIREGIKDAKYIATLKKLISENKGSPVAKEAQKYLTSLRKRISIDYNNYVLPGKTYNNMEIVDSTFYKENYMFILEDISENRDSTDYEAFSDFRKKIANYIVQLS